MDDSPSFTLWSKARVKVSVLHAVEQGAGQGRGRVSLNVEDVVAGIKVLGRGILRTVEFNAKQHSEE